ncbi:Aconitase/3-isopropylmalate dehydratase [Xylariaceae sp. FL1651]|nr:Aconitase/3-isopropylmalate dehydratase [Xylariaceae sp. FL1651]
MKTSVISASFHAEFLAEPKDPDAFECKATVFDSPERLQKQLDDPNIEIDRRTILIMRSVGPLGYPGAAEVVNMHVPGRLLKHGVKELPCIGDGRQSGTSGSISILNASPDAANSGNLALVRDLDTVRFDIGRRRVDILVSEEELKARREESEAKGGYGMPESQTPWQDILWREVSSLSESMVLKRAIIFQDIAQKHFALRHNL